MSFSLRTRRHPRTPPSAPADSIASRLEFLRTASPNEQRCIYRESLGFYRSLVVGAIYELDEEPGFDLSERLAFHAAIKSCVDEHPFLSVQIANRDAESPKPSYQRAPTIYIDNDHLVLMEETADDSALESIVEKLLHVEWWDRASPPWSIWIIPLKADRAHQKRVFVAFVYSHALGDGISGLAFHRTFLNSLTHKHSAQEIESSHAPKTPLPGPFDTSSRLPISWSFLLAPFLAVYMPKFITNLLGLRAAASTIDSGTWLGPPVFFNATQTEQTRIKMITIESKTLKNILQACRKNQAKLTGTLHQMIVQALKIKMPQPSITNFASQTAVNMRRSIGASEDEMGLFVSGYYEVHQKENITEIGSEDFWQAARRTTMELAKCAATLEDQPIGLLRFLPSISSWTQGKLGQKRDGSYEISNLGDFKPGQCADMANTKVRISKMVFAQPANVIGAPMTFNFVSVQGGCLVCTVSWQNGALGLDNEQERSFVNDICVSIREGLKTLH